MFLAPPTAAPIYKSKGDQKHCLGMRINLICFDPNTKLALKKRGCINSTRSLKGAALWSGVKRGSSAALTACALKDTFNYRQRKLGRHAASIITTLQLTHHRKNRLAEMSLSPRNFKNTRAHSFIRFVVCSVTFPPVVLAHLLSMRCCQTSQFASPSLTGSSEL